MPQSTMFAVAIALVLGALGFALWYSQQHPRQIVGRGVVRIETGGHTETLQTRDVDINGVRFSEVEMPNGTWIDCGGDCGRAAHDAGAGFWDKQARDRR